MRTSSPSDVERHLDRLSAAKERWVHTGIAERIAYLRAAIEAVLEVDDAWVAEACARRGLDPAGETAGEEWLSGPMTLVRGLRLLVLALERGGAPAPLGLYELPEGQIVARVFPASALDRFLYYDIHAEVWIEPGCAPSQGRIYRDKAAGRFEPGAVCLVLGAGNISSIGALDVVYKLFVEDRVALLKMNPVNAWLGPYLERVFSDLIRDGFVAVVYGGSELGARLVGDPRVDALHLTGSAETHDAIVWGADPAARAERKAAGTPLSSKPVTSELGCVTPVLVVPSRWSDAALDFQALHVASMVTHNASFNCTAGKVLVLSRGWPQRDEFLRRLASALARLAPRPAYYPGATERYRRFLACYPQAVALGRGGEGVVPWTLIPDVPAREGEHALVREAFCGVLAEVSLDVSGPAEYLERAVDFANDVVWGNLSVVLLVDRATARRHAGEVARAIARLRYGAVAVNAWTGVVFGLGVTTWGAFPGNPTDAISSGRGVVHNALLFDHPQKSVLRAPFRIWPKPVWFDGHRNLRTLGRELTRLEARPALARVARVAVAGLGG